MFMKRGNRFASLLRASFESKYNTLTEVRMQRLCPILPKAKVHLDYPYAVSPFAADSTFTFSWLRGQPALLLKAAATRRHSAALTALSRLRGGPSVTPQVDTGKLVRNSSISLPRPGSWSKPQICGSQLIAKPSPERTSKLSGGLLRGLACELKFLCSNQSRAQANTPRTNRKCTGVRVTCSIITISQHGSHERLGRDFVGMRWPRNA